MIFVFIDEFFKYLLSFPVIFDSVLQWPSSALFLTTHICLDVLTDLTYLCLNRLEFPKIHKPIWYSKLLFYTIDILRHPSNDGSVVEWPPATRSARVRFPVVAILFFTFSSGEQLAENDTCLFVIFLALSLTLIPSGSVFFCIPSVKLITLIFTRTFWHHFPQLSIRKIFGSFLSTTIIKYYNIYPIHIILREVLNYRLLLQKTTLEDLLMITKCIFHFVCELGKRIRYLSWKDLN